MAAHSSVLAWRIPGTGEPGELPSMGSQRVGHDWATSLSLSQRLERTAQNKQTAHNDKGSLPAGSCHHISLVSVHPRSYISMRHHSLTYHLNSLMRSKAFQDYQVQGEFRCRNYFKGTDAYGLVTKSCLTLCNPMDCSLPGSSVHEILQARTLEWAAISFSNRCLCCCC